MFAKTRTWIVHKDRYGSELPPPKYQSDLRLKRRRSTGKRSRVSGVKKPRKMTGFTPELYMREAAWAFGGFLAIIGLLYYVAPKVLSFLGLY